MAPNSKMPHMRSMVSRIFAVIIVMIYATGLLVCWFIPADSVLQTMRYWSIIYFVPLTIILGIKFGTQNKEYWM